jgi:hypothetical protein
MPKKNQIACAALIAAVLGSGFARCLSQTIRPAAEIKFREPHFRKRPLVDLVFDILLRNDRSEPRWFLLPGTLEPKPASFNDHGGVDTLEVFAPQGRGRVIVGHFLGTGGFYALLLPAGGEVRLQQLTMSFWEELPDQVQVEVVIAKRFTIGGEKGEDWFGIDPMSSVKADIEESAESHMVRSRHSAANKEVATIIEEDGRLQLQVPLKRHS